jgi:hypothetical protein
MKNRISVHGRWWLLATIVLASLSSGSFAAEELSVTIIDPFVNLHTGPGRGFPIIQVIERGEQATLLKKRTDWILVVTDKGFEGWAHRDSLSLTLGPDDILIEFNDPDIEDFVARRLSAGFGGGDFGGAATLSVFMGYRFTNNLSIEGKFTQAIGNFSDSLIAGASIVHETWPEWRISPYFSLGVAVIQTTPDATLVQPLDRTDVMLMTGVGAQTYISRSFVLRTEFVNNLILTSRNENQEVNEWKIGLSFFF